MIAFVEKEPFRSNSSMTDTLYIPVYMVKNGNEYFVINRVVEYADAAWRDYEIRKSSREVAAIQRFLMQTDGLYFKFNGAFDDPFEMIEDMRRQKHTFTEPDNLFIDRLERNGGYFDFHGNRRESSAAFHYRIYDPAMAKRIMKEVSQ